MTTVLLPQTQASAGTTRVQDFIGAADAEINLYAPTGAGGADHRRWGLYNDGTNLVIRRLNDAYSGHTTVGTFADDGSLVLVGGLTAASLTAASLKTSHASVALPTGVATTIVALTPLAAGAWRVWAVGDTNPSYAVIDVAWVNGAPVLAVSTVNGCTAALSGNNLQLTQTSGGSRTVDVYVLRIA